jgi:hypothetical protein
MPPGRGREERARHPRRERAATLLLVGFLQRQNAVDVVRPQKVDPDVLHRTLLPVTAAKCTLSARCRNNACYRGAEQ